MGYKLAEAYIELALKSGAFLAGLQGTESSMLAFALKGQGIFGSLFAGIGTREIAGFIADVAQAGGDLTETLNKVGVVFGGSAGTVIAMADDMANRFGSIKNETLDAAANIGMIGQAAGFSESQSAGMAEMFVRLADDASSFFNVPFDVALEKIRAGLVGQSRPLREFGVLLSEAAVKEQALAMGFEPLKGEFTEQEKVMARAVIITESLKKVQGDHARTIDQYTNMVRKLNGEWANFKAEIGTDVAGTGAVLMKLVREQPTDVLKSIFSLGAWQNFNFQDIADKIYGVNKDTKSIVDASPRQQRAVSEMDFAWNRAMQMKADNERLREEAALSREKAATDRRFSGTGLGISMGGGGMYGGIFGPAGAMLAMNASMADIDAKIAAKQKEIGAWGGSHVTDPLAFLRDAQEKILKPTDETAKKQLDELVKSRAALEKIADMAKKPGGIVLKGREN